MRKKPGPKPKLARDKRSVEIRSKVTPPEARAIKAAAGTATVSDWARAVLMAAAAREMK